MSEAYVRIERVGRWLHHITIVSPVNLPSGPMNPAAKDMWMQMESQPPWLAWGARRAARKGARKLRAFNRKRSYRDHSFDSRMFGGTVPDSDGSSCV